MKDAVTFHYSPKEICHTNDIKTQRKQHDTSKYTKVDRAGVTSIFGVGIVQLTGDGLVVGTLLFTVGPDF